jgi:hypothetical protein
VNQEFPLTKSLTGSIKLDDQDLIDEIIESEEWVGGLDDWIWEVIYLSNKIKGRGSPCQIR